MPHPSPRARLDLTRLDDRTVPSTVTATTTARPLDFTATGTLTTSDLLDNGGKPVTSTSNNTVTLAGSIGYTSNTAGQSGSVTVTGVGTGTRTPVAPNTTGGGNFSQTVTGSLAFSDASGTVATTTPLTATAPWSIPGGGSGTNLLGPADLAGTFDVSTFQFQAAWGTATSASSGTLTATLADTQTQATDLAFSTTSAAAASDGTLSLDFAATVTGKLLTAPDETTAVGRVTATWEGNGQSEAVDLDLPIYWNTGTVAATVSGLTPPAWATSLTVRLDPANQVAEADETNNTWTVTLADVFPPAAPPPPADPAPEAPTDPGFPRVPSGPSTIPAGFNTTTGPDGSPIVRWINAENRVIASAPAFENFTGPVTVAAGDVNGDGVLDAVVAAGAGGGPRVRVLDGKTGTAVTDFFAYDADFRGGVTISVADLNTDGHADLVTGAGAGGGPHVKAFDGVNGAILTEFFAYDADFRGGVNVATADLNRDGVPEIIVGPQSGSPPEVRVFDARTGTMRFSVLAAGADASNGVTLTIGKAPDGTILVAADPNGAGPAKLFRQQMLAGGPLLEEVYTPADGVVVS